MMSENTAKETPNPKAPEEKSILNSNNMYFTFFEYAPISLWIEDFSKAKKHIDELVANSNTDIKNYIETNPDIISKLASLVTVKDVNKAAITMYKAKSKEDLLKNLGKVFTPSSNEGFEKLLVDLLFGKTETEIEAENTTFEGDIINTLVKFKIAEGSENTLENVIVSVEDITNQVKLKNALLNSKKKYKEAYNIINKSSSVAILCENKWDFPIVFASENTINLFGYEYTELLDGNVKLSELIFRDDLAWVSAAFIKFLKDEKSNELKLPPFRIFTKKGDIKWIRINLDVVRNNADEITHIQGIAEDITEHRKIEAESRKHLLAVEQSANIITITDSKGVIEYINPKFTEIYGFTKEEVLGENFSILKSGKHTEKFYFQMWQSIKGGNIWKGQLQNKAKNGNLIWIQHTITPIINDADEIVNYIAISEDITEQKKIEDLFFESNQRIKDQFNNTPLASIIWDLDFKVIEWNNAAERIFGYTAEEAKKNNIKGLLTPPNLVSEMKQILENIVTGKRALRNTNQNITKSGKIITCDWYNVQLKDVTGNIIGVASLVDDVTERVNSKNLLEESEKKYRDIFEKSIDAVLIIKQGVFVDCNESTLKIFGYGDKQSLLQNHPSVLSPETQYDGINSFIKAEEMMRITLETGSHRFRWDHQKKNGQVFPTEVSLTRVEDSDHIPTIHTIIRDITESKKAEDLLFESNQRLKDQFNHTPLASIIWDSNFNVLEWNNSAERIFGYSAEEAKGLNVRDLITPPNFVAEMKKIQENVLTVKYAHRNTNENKTKSGKIITCDWYNVTLKDPSGNIIGVASLADDITERINAKNLLEKSERKFREIFEKSIDAVLILKDGFFVDCNEAAIKMFGLDRETLFNIHPSQLSPEFQPNGESSFAKAEKMVKITLEKGSNRYRCNQQHIGGQVFPTEVTLTKIDKSDSGFTIHVVIKDITESVKKEQLEDVLFNISKAALTIGDFKEFSLFVRNELHNIIDTSNFYIAMYNAETDMINTPVFVDEREDVEEFSAKNSLTGYVIKTKKPLILNEEALLDLIKNREVDLIGELSKVWIGVPLIIKGECIGAIVVQSYENENAFSENDVQLLEFVADQISTIIQRKKIENELNTALIQAKESDRLKSAFLANMSHEIRTPMNGIIGFSEFFLDPNITKNKQREYAEIIIKSSKRLLSIVNDILDISKIEAGVVTLSLESVNLNKCMDELCDFYLPIAKEHHLELICTKGLENYKSVIETDKTKLNQVLTNLLSNAFKFTEQGSVEFGYQLIENNLQFYVKDTGIGVEDSLQNIIFNRFTQGSQNISKQHKGTGLGLAITKKIVELFKGEIWLKSSNKGTTIYFTIPFRKSKMPLISSVIEEQKPTIPVKNKMLTILVAEDEEYNMMYITELFSATNFTIIEAGNGKKALELAQNHPEIDLVLMDIKMPIMDGTEAMIEIKKLNPNLPIIALSAFAMESDKESALKNGFSAYLTKPLDRKLLFKLVEDYSSKK